MKCLSVIDAVVAEQRVHRVHVHPQFFWERTNKVSQIFPSFDPDTNMHPQVLAPCAIPAMYV